MARPGGLWRNADFMKLWGGETISQLGTQVTQLALPLTAILTLHATSTQVGILNAAAYLPFLLLTLIAGVWVDRKRRRPILIISNVGRAVVLAAVPLLAFAGLLRIEHVYLAALLVGVFTVTFDLAYQSYLPALIDRSDLVEGNSKLEISYSTAQVAGPGIGGVLIQLVAAPAALLVNSASFLASVVTLLAIRKKEPEPEVVPATERSVLREMWEGLRLTFGNPTLRACALEAAGYNLSYLMIETVFLLYATRELDLSPGLIGFTLACGAVGMLVGSLLPQRLARRLGLGPAICWSVMLGASAPLLIPLAAGPRPLVIAVLITSYFLGGAGVAVASIHVVSIRQAITPDRVLGRVNASYRFLTWGSVPVGALLGGVLGGVIGLRPTLFVGAFLMILAGLVIVFSPVRRLRELPAAETPDQPAGPPPAENAAAAPTPS